MYKNNDAKIEKRINNELDLHNVAYKIIDKEGNTFVYGGIENNSPWYRTNRGCKHISDLTGYKVIEKHCEL